MRTLQDLVESLKDKKGTAISWREKDIVENKEVIKKISYQNLYELAGAYSKGLLELGLKPGDRVAIFSRNNPHFTGLMLGINNAQMIDVPRGENSTQEEINYILEHSGAKACVVEDEQLLNMVRKEKHNNLEHIISIQKLDKANKVTHMKDLIVEGLLSKKEIPEFGPEESACIIYTSGTTGTPKGVELTHKNLMADLEMARGRIDIRSDDKFLSILPAWHGYERMTKLAALDAGAETFYSSTSPAVLMKDLAEQSPTMMASVPRVWEMIYRKIQAKVKEEGRTKNTIFNVLSSLSDTYSKSKGDKKRGKGSAIGNSLGMLVGAIPHKILQGKVYDDIRKRLGGRMRFVISGGSALPAHVDDFFYAAGLELLEGYGLTEASPVVTGRTAGTMALYSVGPLLKGIESRILHPETGKEVALGEEGILHIRGDNIMKGYYRDHDATSAVLSPDGWLNTGDLGYFDNEGNLYISGRWKEIIVLSNGENVNPIPLEDELKRSDYISLALVVGQDWKHLGALVYPQLESLKRYAQQNNIPYDENNWEESAQDPRIQSLYKREIRKYTSTSKFKGYERINEFRFVKSIGMDTGELTATLKPMRHKIEKKYRTLIDSMHDAINTHE